jgi:hypothetical protein
MVGEIDATEQLLLVEDGVQRARTPAPHAWLRRASAAAARSTRLSGVCEIGI